MPTGHGYNRRHRKGLSTLCLLILAELVSLANAVTVWNSYQRWSNKNTGQANSGSPFAEAAQKAQECAAAPETDTTCPPEKRPSLPPARIYPRSRLRVNPSTKHFASAEDYCRDCSAHCEESEAFDKLCLIRGGHIVSPVVEKATEVVTHGGTPYGLPLNAWKVIFQAILTFINVTCWLIPLKSKKMSENKLALSLANAFSGGVFLSLAFGHLLPECTHGFHDMNEAAPYMLALGGYMLIFFVEKIAFDAEHILHEATHGHGDVKGNGSMLTTDPSMAALSTGRGAIILLGALAVHSILEMTALGLADSFGDSALLTLSIALHQPAESIALLVAFIKSGLSEGDIIKYLSIFSAMGPIGVALGMAVNEFAAPIVDAVMLAVVAGTFIYVGATEVIPEEFEEPDYKWKKFFALVSGIVSIFVITQYTMSLEAS